VKESQITPDRSLHSDLDWAALLLGALFVHDGEGRLEARKEPGAGRAASPQAPGDPQRASSPAPRFVFVRTRHGNLWRFRADLALFAVRELARLAAKELPLPEAEASAAGRPPPERLEAWRRILAAGDDRPGEGVGHEQRGWALRLPEAAAGATARVAVPEPTLLVYEVDGLPLYLAPGGERRAIDTALGLGLEPFAEIFEL